jgi:hypothetical protein
MATLGISKDFWRHTRAFQDILAEGRQEGDARKAESWATRKAAAARPALLPRGCWNAVAGPLTPPPAPASKPSACRN